MGDGVLIETWLRGAWWITTLGETAAWLISAAVAPLFGGLAAAAASVAARDRRDWVRPRRCVGPVIRGVVVWCLTAWLIAFAWRWGVGDGDRGRGGDSGPSQQSSQTDAVVAGDVPLVRRSPAVIDSGGDVTVVFVVSPANESRARQFACDLLIRPGRGETERDETERGETTQGETERGNKAEAIGRRVAIRGRSMAEFEQAFASELSRLAEKLDVASAGDGQGDDPTRPLTVVVQDDPYPGVPAMRSIRRIIDSFGRRFEVVREG